MSQDSLEDQNGPCREQHLVFKRCLYAATESSNRQRTLTGASDAAE
jgi:hypothetical protein